MKKTILLLLPFKFNKPLCSTNLQKNEKTRLSKFLFQKKIKIKTSLPILSIWKKNWTRSLKLKKSNTSNQRFFKKIKEPTNTGSNQQQFKEEMGIWQKNSVVSSLKAEPRKWLPNQWRPNHTIKPLLSVKSCDWGTSQIIKEHVFKSTSNEILF